MRRGTLIALIAYLILRWILATNPGYSYDVRLYKNWALFAARDGVAEIYSQPSGMDYPPLYAYILYPFGKIYLAAVPEAADALGDQLLDSPTLTILVKLPCLIFDFLVAWLLVLWVRRLAPELATQDRWTRLLPWLYLLNPAILFDSAYWGQPDAIHSAFVLGAFLAFSWVRFAWPSWVLLTLATLMKPLGAPFFPLLGVASLVRYGFRSTVLGGLAAVGTGLVVFAPFLATGRLGETISRILGDVKVMSYTSTNAHNLWWALGGWRNSEVPWLGPFTATEIALTLFGVFYAGVLLVVHRLHRMHGNGPIAAELPDIPPGSSAPGAPTPIAKTLAGRVPRDGGIWRSLLPSPNPEGGITPTQIVGLAFVVGLGFFMLSTQMHENHMFIAIPLLLPLTVIRSPRLTWARGLFAAVTVGVLLNLVLHDLDPARQELPRLGILASGGESGVRNEHLQRPFFVAELWAIRFSLWWNLVLFAVVLFETFRPKGWLDRLGRAFALPTNSGVR